MDRYDEDVATTMPVEVEKYVQETVCNMLESCNCQDYWEVKFTEAVDSQRQLQEQVYVLLRRLEEADFRCAKSRVILLCVIRFSLSCISVLHKSNQRRKGSSICLCVDVFSVPISRGLAFQTLTTPNAIAPTVRINSQ